MKFRSMRLILPLPVIAIAIFIFILVFQTFQKSEDRFSKDISKCNIVTTQLRFSCYRSVIETYYKEDLQGFLKKLKNNGNLSVKEAFARNRDVSYAIFGTNCHTFYHAVGDFVATYSNDNLQTMLEAGPSTCTNGYTMGIYKRFALKNRFDSAVLKEFFEVCKKGAENQCAHEIGHLLHDKYSYSVLKTLDDISLKNYHLTYPQSFEYTTFKEISSLTSLDKPFEECRELVPEAKVAQCFTGVGHNLFLFSEFSQDGYKTIFEECGKINTQNKENCFAFLIYRIGINEAATRFLSNKFEKGNKICDEVIILAGSEDLKKHCYIGIGGGIGLFVDSEYSTSEIKEENVAGAKEEFLNYAKLCEKSKKEFIEQCFAGLFGTRYSKLYDLLKIYYEPIERLRPSWNSDFEVVG